MGWVVYFTKQSTFPICSFSNIGKHHLVFLNLEPHWLDYDKYAKLTVIVSGLGWSAELIQPKLVLICLKIEFCYFESLLTPAYVHPLKSECNMSEFLRISAVTLLVCM